MNKRTWIAAVAVVFSFLVIATARARDSQDETLKPVSNSGTVQSFELPSWGNGAPALLIDLPAGVEVRRGKGPDFDVYSIVKSDGTRNASMGIYVGHNPSTDWPGTAAKRTVKVGSAPVTWHDWQEKRGGETIHHSEALIKNFFPCGKQKQAARKLPPEYPPPPAPIPAQIEAPDAGCGLMIHVFAQGSDSVGVKRLADAASTLRKKS